MKKCVLIYDDDLDILSVCKIILKQHNYRVETRNRNTDLINDIKKLKPDMVFMDIRIPELGGEKAVTLMKTNRDTENIPIVLFSANPEIEEIYKRTGADGFLKKPFEINTLLDVLKDNIAKTRVE
ncbi:MAG TPA: response regulator [Puia sp.]|nr:response regulator [Puia sp.]